MSGVRIDKWLWAARFFRTRALAKQALEKGQVSIDGVRARPSREVQVGMQLSLRQGDAERVVDVLALSEQRGPASQAQALYQETAASLQAREAARALRRAERAGWQPPAGRPQRNQRRRLGAIKRQSPD